ncbi:hypothetical protein K457DRAFT_137478 [Linnemannia elongata AG-77]|uniref:Uncharacterized protein n=1 Tax=Linnemannia elongata AG-77 TaxID=1314771 RepID=A0A197JZP1_9FUNG|nr:hypothetical protein K457DRAFT_137478 [Linnemannia elongata AG-77]
MSEQDTNHSENQGEQRKKERKTNLAPHPMPSHAQKKKKYASKKRLDRGKEGSVRTE